MNKLFLCLFLFTVIACKSSKKDIIETAIPEPRTYISFGSGGGFTGAVETAEISDKGIVNMSGSKKSLKKNVVKQLFNNYEVLNIDKVSLNDPGNFYYFLEFHENDKLKQRLVWSKSTKPIPDNLKLYYNLLEKLARKAK